PSSAKQALPAEIFLEMFNIISSCLFPCPWQDSSFLTAIEYHIEGEDSSFGNILFPSLPSFLSFLFSFSSFSLLFLILFSLAFFHLSSLSHSIGLALFLLYSPYCYRPVLRFSF
ncbi:MAG: hypothetical protein IIZ39_11815, partial [Blautia sp.]|nr:hypothetical protein [Blautia sp.]